MRYFFSTRDGEFYSDTEGQDYPDHDAAKAAATDYAAELIHGHPEMVWTNKELEVLVTDNRGLLLFSLTVQGAEAPALRPGNGR